MTGHNSPQAQPSPGPFMAETPPANFVPRPEEMEALMATLTTGAEPQKTIALTTIWRDAGGYGKTTLA